MDLDFSPEDLAFRDEVRAFIAQAFDEDMHAKSEQSKNAHIDKDGQIRWLKRLNDKGWIDPTGRWNTAARAGATPSSTSSLG